MASGQGTHRRPAVEPRRALDRSERAGLGARSRHLAPLSLCSPEERPPSGAKVLVPDGGHGHDGIVGVGVPPCDRLHPPELFPHRVHSVQNHQEVDVGIGVSIMPRPGAEQDDTSQALSVEHPKVLCDRSGHAVRIRPRAELRHLPDRLASPPRPQRSRGRRSLHRRATPRPCARSERRGTRTRRPGDRGTRAGCP